MAKKFPEFRQLDSIDCGPTCLRMIAKYYGRNFDLRTLRDYAYISNNGVSMLGLSRAAEHIGFRTMGVKTNFERFATKAIFPCIIHWREDHFCVIYKVRVKKGRDGRWEGKVYVSDPAFGLVTYCVDEFMDGWCTDIVEGKGNGFFLQLVPTISFFNAQDKGIGENKFKLSHFLSYFRPYSKMLFQVLLGLLLSLGFTFIMPFLTQSVVDVGIMNSNMNFIYLIMAAQLIIAVSELVMGFIQSWIMLHVSSRVSIALISDFITKMLRLPISFFETTKTGDIMQRIGDHSRIQSFFTSTTLGTVLSFISFFVFAIILGYYNVKMLLIFLVGYTCYVIWVMLFLKRRRELDFKHFDKASRNQSSVIEIVTGAQEIKLTGSEYKMRSRWETIQTELFHIGIQGLTLSQMQSAGSFFFSNITNIILSIFSAYLVINGQITLGMMMSLSYIIGQLKGPIGAFIGFVHSYQDAKISLERLGEIHLREDETKDNKVGVNELLSTENDIYLNNVTFSYQGHESFPVLRDVSITIPKNKITAIVGESGSGKTTLLKLLLGYYTPLSGDILIGHTKLGNLDVDYWRGLCATVMQDGALFSMSVAENIAISGDHIDKQKLYDAAVTANIHSFIEQMPSGYNSKIGPEGNGVSQGQKQRIQIARAVYKDPKYLFLDEATNALDANNEKTVIENLRKFYVGRTVVVVAHRLSTVRFADQIVVLHQGAVVEEGTHESLIEKHGYYYDLIKNQLEL